MINYDLCDKGWELYDLWVYHDDRAQLEPEFSKDAREAKEKFEEHKRKCLKCGYLDER